MLSQNNIIDEPDTIKHKVLSEHFKFVSIYNLGSYA